MKLPDWYYYLVILFAVSIAGCGGGGGGGTTTSVADTSPPSVSVTAPVAGATVSGTIVVSASTSDNVGVSKVEFLVNGILASTDSSAPFNYSWNTASVPNGSYTLTAKAYDSANNAATSTVTVSVNSAAIDAIAPSLSVTAPANGATVSGTVNVTANATDNVGVSKVEFFVDGTLEFTASSSPFVYSWNSTGRPDGTRTLTAKAYDSANNSTSSSAVTVTVQNAPIASITSPIANTLASGTILVDVTATDDIGVTKVELYEGANLIGTSTSTPYRFSWNTTTLTNGNTYSLTAKAYDSAGHVTTSAAVPMILREMRVRSVGPEMNIYGIGMDINVPAQVSLVAVPTINDVSYATATGVAATLGASLDTNLIPPLRVTLIPGISFGIGEFITINCTLAPGSTILPSDFSYASFAAYDINGTRIGETAEFY